MGIKSVIRKLTFRGEAEGVALDYSEELHVDSPADLDQPNFVGAKSFLESIGFTASQNAPAGSQAAPSLRQRLADTVPQEVPGAQPVYQPQQQYQQQHQQGQYQAGWGCPVHGMERVKAAYKGPGFECGMSSPFQTEWTRPEQRSGRNGPLWFCKHTSVSG